MDEGVVSYDKYNERFLPFTVGVHFAGNFSCAAGDTVAEVAALRSFVYALNIDVARYLQPLPDAGTNTTASVSQRGGYTTLVVYFLTYSQQAETKLKQVTAAAFADFRVAVAAHYPLCFWAMSPSEVGELWVVEEDGTKCGDMCISGSVLGGIFLVLCIVVGYIYSTLKPIPSQYFTKSKSHGAGGKEKEKPKEGHHPRHAHAHGAHGHGHQEGAGDAADVADPKKGQRQRDRQGVPAEDAVAEKKLPSNEPFAEK